MGSVSELELSEVPRWRQVASILEGEIKAGVWQPGRPIPSRAQLGQRFGVAQETCSHAGRWLAAHGYVVRVPGIGLVVTEPDRWVG